MNDQDEKQLAAEALASVQAHQERTRRAARLPWWVYAAVFVVAAGGSALNDFVDLTGAKVIAVLILVAFVVVFATRRADESILGKMRGVEPRRSFVPWVFGVVAFIGGAGAWLISQYGSSVTGDLADAVGLSDYPNTVAGVLYGAAFTALFAIGRLLTAASQRSTDR